MLSLELNRNSWHYKLATLFKWQETTKIGYEYNETTYQYVSQYRQNDFCSYVRRILLACIVLFLVAPLAVTALVIFLAIMLAPVGNLLAWAIYSVLHLTWIEMMPAAYAGLAMTIFSAIVAFVIALTKGWIKIPLLTITLPSCPDIPYCEDTKHFLIAAYTVFHDKVCFKLKFNNGETNAASNDGGTTTT